MDSGGAVWPFGFAVNSGGLVVVTGELGMKNANQRESERNSEKKKVEKEWVNTEKED